MTFYRCIVAEWPGEKERDAVECLPLCREALRRGSRDEQGSPVNFVTAVGILPRSQQRNVGPWAIW